ncbi:SigE family RNA polymerase sigma factor [Actinoplanes sp. NPDC049118]|uniref:SigE family RNA polymerase sigma factor n=1 Tax=Actinoplanes sp. NPDC049118 TaxID=3155769 RepID=UPI0033DF6995
MRGDRDKQFHDFVLAQRAGLLRTATLLTAGDRHLAEDLVQSTLTKLYVAWPSFQRADNAEAYMRRTLTNALSDERRRLWRRRERPTAELPELPRTDQHSEPMADSLRTALRELPPRMRAAVVFRYFHELTVTETAAALDCSEGTVKSQTSRALAHLRTALEIRPAAPAFR